MESKINRARWRWMEVVWGVGLFFFWASASLIAQSPNKERESELTICGVLPAAALTDYERGYDSRLVCFDALPTSEGEKRLFVFRINRLTDKEQSLLSDHNGKVFQRLSFVEAVLIAEGIPDLHRYAALEQYRRFLNELAKEIGGEESPVERAQKIFSFLHQKILYGPYIAENSSTAQALSTGSYNCMSATVLFIALASHFGLNAVPLEAPKHVKCRLFYEDKYFDIETTCRSWYLMPDHPLPDVPKGDPSRNWSTVPQLKDLTGDQPALHFGPGKVREVTPVEFVAAVYYNRAGDMSVGKYYGPAMAQYLKGYILDPENSLIVGNLKVTLNNLAVELAQQKNFAQAARLTEQCLLFDPEYENFRVNLPLYYQSWAKELREAGKIDQAQEIESRIPTALQEPPKAVEETTH